MSRFLIAWLLIAHTGAYAVIYKWTDKQGNIYYSDLAYPGATLVNIPEEQTHIVSAMPRVVSNLHLEKQTVTQPAYTELGIQQPQHNATIRNNQGKFKVIVHMNPDLFAGDKLQLIFDGSPIGTLQTSRTFQLDGIYRGGHTIAVQIVRVKSDVVAISKPITVYIFRPYKKNSLR